jgi:hypothetical protein
LQSIIMKSLARRGGWSRGSGLKKRNKIVITK